MKPPFIKDGESFEAEVHSARSHLQFFDLLNERRFDRTKAYFGKMADAPGFIISDEGQRRAVLLDGRFSRERPN